MLDRGWVVRLLTWLCGCWIAAPTWLLLQTHCWPLPCLAVRPPAHPPTHLLTRCPPCPIPIDPPPSLQSSDFKLESPRPVVTYMSRNFFSRGVLNEHDILRYILAKYNVTLRVTTFEVSPNAIIH